MKILRNHQWFADDDTTSKLFEILMFSELGLVKDFDIFNQFEIKINGETDEGNKTMRVKNMEISLSSKSLYLVCDDNGEDVDYCVDLDESIAQFVKKFWGE